MANSTSGASNSASSFKNFLCGPDGKLRGSRSSRNSLDSVPSVGPIPIRADAGTNGILNRISTQNRTAALPKGMVARGLINSAGAPALLAVPEAIQPERESTGRLSSSRSSSIKADPNASPFTSRLVYPITDKTHPIYLFVSQLEPSERRELGVVFNEVKKSSPDVKNLTNVDLTMLLLMRIKPKETSNVLSMALLKGSNELKQTLLNNKVTVSSCVIGSGPVGIAAAATNGNRSTIVIDGNEVVGGSSFGGRHAQWWGQEAEPQVGFAINSTSRMPQSDVPRGGGFDFNPGPLQIATDVNADALSPGQNQIAVRHLSGDSWPDASELARTVLLNATTIKNTNGTDFLLGFKVDSVNYNQSKKLYEITAKNASGEKVAFNALTLTQAAGLGTPQVPRLNTNFDLPRPVSSNDLQQEVNRTADIIKRLDSPSRKVRTAATNELSTVKVLTPQQWFDITKYSQQPSKLYQGRKPGYVGDGDSIFTVLESVYRLRGKQALHDSAGNYRIQSGAWFSRKFGGGECKNVKDTIRSRYADIQTVAGRRDKDNGLEFYGRLDTLNTARNGQFIGEDEEGDRETCDFLVVGTGYDIGTKPAFKFTGAPEEKDKFARVDGEPACFKLGPQGILIGPATGPEVNQAKRQREGTLGISENTASVFLRAKDGARAQKALLANVATAANKTDTAYAKVKAGKIQSALNANEDKSFGYTISHEDVGITFSDETAKSALTLALSSFDLKRGAQFNIDLIRLDDGTVNIKGNGINKDDFNALWSRIPTGGKNHILNSVSIQGEEVRYKVDVSKPKTNTANERVQTVDIDIDTLNTFSDMDSLRTVSTGEF
ncbi:MAG: hypothetical protein VX185_07940 [Pseudomonadota bacterium]|nr:hypothetical protein [Pseudomonadota bacterium]